MRPALLVFSIVLLASSGFAATRPHTVALGKWHTVAISSDSGETQPIKVRDLIIDGRLREYTTGGPHEVTDRLFVIRRAYRINDSLPDSKKSTQWVWRLGGWISVDRQTGHVAQLNLPAFDSDLSDATWYRDYAAYCGVSDDGSKSYMVVSQLGKRKPVLKKEYTGEACPAPKWERSPSRVTFMAAGEKSSFVIRAHGADLQLDSPEEEGQQ